MCAYICIYIYVILSPYSASDSLRFRTAAEVRMAKFKAATSTSKFCAAMVASWRPGKPWRKPTFRLKKKKRNREKRKWRWKSINQKNQRVCVCVCVKMNMYVCNTLKHPPTVTPSPSTVDIPSSTAKDPSKIPESVARCHGHHEWHKRMSWASAYPNDNPSGESDASLPFWWIFLVAHHSFPAKNGWTTFFPFFLKVASKSKWCFFGDPAPKERMRWIRVNTTCWHWR